MHIRKNQTQIEKHMPNSEIITKNTDPYINIPYKTFPKVAQVWNSATGISFSPWYTYGENQTPGLMPLGIITKNTPERLTIDLSEGCTGLKLCTRDKPKSLIHIRKNQTPGSMPLGIITKNTPERLTFSKVARLNFCTPDTHTEKSDSWLYELLARGNNTARTADLWPFRRLHRSETRHPGSALVPDTHTEKSDSWLNAFRNYYKKHTRTADLWPFRRLHRSETRHPGLALVPDTHTEKSDSWLNAFRNYYKKHTRTADHWPFRRLHRSETRHPGSALVPDTHTEKSDSWLNAFRNYYKKHTTVADLWPFQRLHRSETRHPGSARSPWYTYGEISIRAHCL